MEDNEKIGGVPVKVLKAIEVLARKGNMDVSDVQSVICKLSGDVKEWLKQAPERRWHMVADAWEEYQDQTDSYSYAE